MKIGLCLSGGGIKGAAHVGALKAFQEENIKFDYISGTSSGSIVATLYAAGFNADEIWELFQKYAKKIKYVDRKNVLKGIWGFIVKRKIIIDGLNSGEVIEKIVQVACKEKNIIKINDIKMPLLIPSVNLKNGEVYIFCSKKSRGNFLDKIKYLDDITIGRAVRASCSYPGIFSPCPYKNIELIDGGIRENIPWKETKQLGADKVISIIFKDKINKDCCRNLIEVAGRAIEILCHELSTYELNGADYLLEIKSENVSLLDTSKIQELYDLGYEITKNKMREIKLQLK